MSAFSRLISGAARSFGPVATAIAPDPGSKFIVSTVTGELGKGEQARKEQEKLATLREERRNMLITPTPRPENLIGRSTGNSGFGSGFGDFLTQASTNILSPLGSFVGGLTSLFGGQQRPPSVITQPALTTVTNVGAQETQSSGVNEAFVGGLPNLIGTAGRILRSPGGISGAIGTAVGGALSLMDGSGRPLRITRKLKRLAQMAYQISGGNLSNATVLFAQMGGPQVDDRTFVLILTKRFRNDGPVVTKAALRKTKTTIRRLKNMCDMYDSLRPRATARRRATPMRRATTTLIKN